MSDIKILTVVGARPQFVKAAALSRELAKDDRIEEFLVHTGQHFDQNMSDIFFEEMAIPKPRYNLDINSLSHGAMTGRMLEGLEELIQKEQPSMVLVYGDTNSTIAGALAAKKMHVPVGHVEAGLRSFNNRMPEEINRILTDRISDILFCPTETAVSNLQREGFDSFECKVVRSGDVMQDAANFYATQSEEKSTVLKELGLEGFVLCTLHRAENTDDSDRLKAIVSALNKIHEETKVVIPLHPRTVGILRKLNLQLNALVIDPVGYFDMIELLKHCKLVLTDSGGLQKEAFFFKRNCVTMRDQTEWTELVDHGFNQLAGADEQKILEAYSSMLNHQADFDVDLYGNGKACSNIREELIQYLG